MSFIGPHIAGTTVPSPCYCPKSSWRAYFPALILVVQSWLTDSDKVLCQNAMEFPTPSVLIAGKHNTTPITGCTGYNPALLVFTTSTTGGLPPYTYQWQLNNLPLAGETLPFYDPPQIVVAGSYSYNCAIADAAGAAVFTLPKLITIVADPEADIAGGGVYCQHTVITLTFTVTAGTGTNSCQWQSSAENITFINIPGANGPTYLAPASAAGIIYYRVNIFPAAGSCNNATSPAVAVVVNALPATSPIYHF
jgi:hypothetical protein